MLPTDHTRTLPSRNPLAMFAPNPAGIAFENQEKGERIVLLLRAHIATLIPVVLQIFFIAILPFFIVPMLSFIRINILEALSQGQIFWMIVAWYLFVFGFSLYKFIFWYFNVYLVTNERIVDFDFRGILHKEASYTNLSQIQDVTPKVVGFFGTFFHYGNVFIQTAGTNPEFEFSDVENPDKVARVILEQFRHEEAEKPGEIV